MPNQDNPELKTLYASGFFVALAVGVAFYLNDGLTLSKADLKKMMNDFFRDNRGSVIPLSGSLSIALLTSWYNRVTFIANNNEVQVERHNKLTLHDLNAHSEQVDQLTLDGDYLSAANHCTQARAILQALYAQDQRDSLQQKIDFFVYKQAGVLYQKKESELAIHLITEHVKNPKITKESREYVNLITLRGLIYFKQSFLFALTTTPEKSSVYLASAQRDFEEAYKIYPDNVVAFYIRSIKKEYDFIVDHIPIVGFNPKRFLTLNPDHEAQNNLDLLFADACFQKGAWAKALSLYEYHLTKFAGDESNHFMESFAIHLNCIKAYAQLITTHESETIQLMRMTKREGIDTTETSSQVHLIPFEDHRERVKTSVVARFDEASDLLRCELIITDNHDECSLRHANLAHAYGLLVEEVKKYGVSPHRLIVPSESTWSASIDEHQRLASEHRRKAQEEKDPIISPRNTWRACFFESSFIKGCASLGSSIKSAVAFS